jgi:hypothetical protein
VSVKSQSFYLQGNSPQCPLHRWLGRPQSWSGSSSNEKSLPPPGIKPWFSSHLALSLVTALIELLSSCPVCLTLMPTRLALATHFTTPAGSMSCFCCSSARSKRWLCLSRFPGRLQPLLCTQSVPNFPGTSEWQEDEQSLQCVEEDECIPYHWKQEPNSLLHSSATMHFNN